MRFPTPYSKSIIGSLVYSKRDQTDPPIDVPFSISAEINEICNLSCTHCIQKREVSGEVIPEELLLKRIQEIEGAKYFSISGKEPTMTPDKLVRVSHAASEIAEKVILMTNSILLTPELQHRLQGRVHYLDPSLDGCEGVHDAIRGEGAFARSWENICYAADNDMFEMIGLIATLNSGSYKEAGALVDMISDRFGDNGRVKLDVAFYLGWPDDKMLLNEEQFMEAVQDVTSREYKIFIAIPPAYSRFLPRLFRELGVDESTRRYCSDTGLASYLVEGHRLMPSAHVESPAYLLRISSDGNVYFGCTHLMREGKTDQWSIGDITEESLKDIFRRLKNKEDHLFNRLHDLDPRCADADCFQYCKGGDRTAGFLKNGTASDPFCEILREIQQP